MLHDILLLNISIEHKTARHFARTAVRHHLSTLTAIVFTLQRIDSDARSGRRGCGAEAAGAAQLRGGADYRRNGCQPLASKCLNT